MPRLYIGNKNYSSWSMRPWVLMRQAGIDFEEVRVRFDSFAPDSHFKAQLAGVSPTGKVPVLVDGATIVWDSLAIAQYLAEMHPECQLWPPERRLRARAYSAVAEMHSGFTALRRHCPLNIEAHLPEVGALLWRDHPALRADVARLIALWSELLDASAGPLLCGAFSIVDAFYAPVCLRLNTYALPLPAHLQAYVQRVTELPGVQDWVVAALAEHDFRDFEEPYRLRRT